jgi:hypothetical protein
MNKTTEGNVTTQGKTPVNIDALVADGMAAWDAENVFDEEQAVSDAGETAEGETVEDAAEPSTDDADATDEMSDAEKEEQEEGDGTETASEKTYDDGIAGALRYLKDNHETIPPAVAKAIQSLQAEYTKTTTERSKQERDLGDKLAKVDALLEELQKVDEGTQDRDPNDPKVRYSAQQLADFERTAEALGFVKQSTMEQKEATKAQADYLKAATKQALDDFGDAFGNPDGDDIAISADAEAAIKGEYARLADAAKGVTYRDLYILANYKTLVEQARTDAVEAYKKEAATKTQQRVTQRKNAAVVDSSTSTRQAPPRLKYDSKDPRAFDKVMEQAAALGFSSARKVG